MTPACSGCSAIWTESALSTRGAGFSKRRPVLLQVARAVERDADDAADAFLFVCQRLADDEYARLRKFDPAGPVSFLTWLWYPSLAIFASMHSVVAAAVSCLPADPWHASASSSSRLAAALSGRAIPQRDPGHPGGVDPEDEAPTPEERALNA